MPPRTVRRALACALTAAACASGGHRPDYSRSYRGTPQASWLKWASVLQSRYGCDTTFVKAGGGPPLGPGIDGCAAAARVRPALVRAGSDSAGLREEWIYTSSMRSGLPGVWDAGPQGRCRLVLSGPDPTDLRVVTVTC